MKKQVISHSNCDLFRCEDNMLYSRVTMSCFNKKAHLLFPHWCLYNNRVNYHWFTVNCSCNSFDVCCIKTFRIDYFSIECIRKNKPDLTQAFHLQHSPPLYPVSSLPLTSGRDMSVKPACAVRDEDSRYEIEHGLN